MAGTWDKKSQLKHSITVLLFREALLGWGIPLLLYGLIVLVVLLGAFQEISPSTGTTSLGILLLVLVDFYLLRTAIKEPIQPKVKRYTLGFGLAWIAITCTQLYLSVNVGPQVYSGIVTLDKPGIPVSLDRQGTAYEVVVQGGFLDETQAHAEMASYRLVLEKEGRKVSEFDGMISEHWVRRRVGRRGSVKALELQNRVLHRLISPGEGIYQLKAVHLDPQLKPMLSATFYQDIYPEKVFWILDAMMLIAAYMLELMHSGKKLPLVLVTASVVTFILGFRILNPPPHGYHDLIGSLIIGLIVGPTTGGVLRGGANFIRGQVFRH